MRQHNTQKIVQRYLKIHSPKQTCTSLKNTPKVCKEEQTCSNQPAKRYQISLATFSYNCLANLKYSLFFVNRRKS